MTIREKIIFKAGDIRREHCLGGFAWGKYEHLIDYDEAFFSILFANQGYIGLHRNVGDFSNVAIKGFMKHAWLYTEGNEIVEAVSEGVLKRNFLHAVMSDYVIILKPLVSEEAKKEAKRRALYVADLKLKYDDHFKFDLEIEESLFADKELALANMKEFDLGVSCSELTALCYVGNRRNLGLYRTKLGKREVILPDSFLSTHFEIVWASRYTTPKIAKQFGLMEEGCELLKEYWKNFK